MTREGILKPFRQEQPEAPINHQRGGKANLSSREALALLCLVILLGVGFATTRSNADALCFGQTLEANLLGRLFGFSCHIID